MSSHYYYHIQFSSNRYNFAPWLSPVLDATFAPSTYNAIPAEADKVAVAKCQVLSL